MTDLERFAAVLLAQLQADGGRGDAPIGVATLLDKLLPYKLSRRLLALETSEDYEALVIRLVAEEAHLVVTSPIEAAEMARVTLEAKVPDLDVLRLLRSATLTFSDDARSRLEGVRPLPGPASPPPAPVAAAAGDETPDRVIPIRRAAEPAVSTATAAPSTPPGPPPEFLTGVAFTPPTAACWECGAVLPTMRAANFCVECGADQRQPRCPSCQGAVDRHWKHCPECGMLLARQ